TATLSDYNIQKVLAATHTSSLRNTTVKRQSATSLTLACPHCTPCLVTNVRRCSHTTLYSQEGQIRNLHLFCPQKALDLKKFSLLFT
ncbi:hypothetical protein J0S82_012254, partial [Galemys pyrenaicus]